jgi:hypothetical protein
MFRKALIAGSLMACSLICGAQSNGARQCLSYEPAEAKLTGTLVRKTYPGPPNYESVKRGDRPETYWVIRLDNPVCVNAGTVDADLNPAQSTIRIVQLVVTSEIYKRRRTLVRKHVVASGRLFGKHTSHHHTSVLLTVKGLEGAP